MPPAGLSSPSKNLQRRPRRLGVVRVRRAGAWSSSTTPSAGGLGSRQQRGGVAGRDPRAVPPGQLRVWVSPLLQVRRVCVELVGRDQSRGSGGVLVAGAGVPALGLRSALHPHGPPELSAGRSSEFPATPRQLPGQGQGVGRDLQLPPVPTLPSALGSTDHQCVGNEVLYPPGRLGNQTWRGHISPTLPNCTSAR